MSADNQFPQWEVFIQSKTGLPFKHVGNLHAADGVLALQNARDLYTRRQEGTSIWVVPTDEIVASNPDDSDVFFDPAEDKIYRAATYYNLPKEAKHI